jgi:hypothetical protein
MLNVNLGAVGSAPELLTVLFKQCPKLRALNLLNSYCTQPHQGLLNSFWVERTIAEKGAALEHLAFCPTENNSLKFVFGGCR